MQKLFALIASTAILSACVNDDTGTPVSFDVEPLLINMADNIIVPRYQDFNDKANALETSINSYCAEISLNNQSTAQQAWRAAAQSWQQTELLQLGPISERPSLRNNIHSFNGSISGNIDACGVDQDLQASAIDQSNSFNINFLDQTKIGLPAIEYLLFADSSSLSCSAGDESELNATWQALSPTEQQQYRCDYALTVAQRLSRDATSMLNSWLPQQNGYRNTFVNSANFSDSMEGLSDALFYIDTVIKDVKLAQPLKINNKCSLSCEQRVEAPYAKNSLALLKANLESFAVIFNGADGPGFDDIIAFKGFTEVNTAFNQNTQAAINIIDKLQADNKSLYDLSLSNNAEQCDSALAAPESGETVCHLYGYVQRISDSLKTEFVGLVDTNIPNNAAGDGD